MQLSKQLVLFRYILKQFGYDDFEKLRDEFRTKESGVNTTGRSYFANVLTNRTEKLIDNHTVYQYDEAIQEYEKRLRENRAEPFFSLKYYQWFALLFTEYYFDQISNHRDSFISAINAFKNSSNDFRQLDDYSEKDLKKLAYWMATGSGKTLLMHCNYWQISKYFPEWENIILITPNEGLSRQHYESFQDSGIDAKLYSGSEESLKTKEGQVLIIEITKLVREKEGEGVSVDVDYFAESKNLIFIDEGHKGSKSEEQTWKNYREYIARGEGSFTIEYSATFGQVVTNKNKFLLDEYSKSIIFDYSYRHFYIDGYGKDFSVFNLDVQNEYNDEQHQLLLTASLLGFYEQLELFDQHKEELRQFNIEKPLWIFVGSKVIGNGSSSLTKTDKQNVSDVSTIVKFFKYALSSPGELQRDIDKILDGASGLRTPKGTDLFKGHFKHLKANRPTAEAILGKVFNGIGSMEALHVKQADGEIALKTANSDHYFGVINIGDVPKYAKKLEEDTQGELPIRDDNFTKSLFHSISEPQSPINILIGSKKFIEGWNSWRVASMGLMNMGKSEGPQIIQLFGRGVRLKGKGLSLQREDVKAPYHIKALQTISIIGLNASYMNRFLEEIDKEVPHYTEYPITIKFNDQEQWDKNLMTFKTEAGSDFKEELLELSFSKEIAKRVSLDLRNRMSMAAGGFNSQIAEDKGDYSTNFLKKYADFIDYNALALEANRYKLLMGYYNLLLSKGTIEKVVKEGAYAVFSHPGQFEIEEAVNGKMQSVAEQVIKDYINKFYADCEKEFLTKNLTYEMLDAGKHEEMFPASRQMVVKIPEKYRDEVIEDLEENIERLYEQDDDAIPTIHFGKHLYSPIASYAEGEKFQEIKTIPTKLNEGETTFVNHLKSYVEEAAADFEGSKLYLLRNLSKKGIGFFMESSTFYPDFILWVVKGNHQHIYFLDPKGIRETRNFNNPKVIFCTQQVNELENKINRDLQANNSKISVSLSAYILSVTSFEEISPIWGEGDVDKQAFEDHNILFIERDMGYLGRMLGKSDRILK